MRVIFSEYLRVTPLLRGNGTNYNMGSRSLVRSVKIPCFPDKDLPFHPYKACNKSRKLWPRCKVGVYVLFGVCNKHKKNVFRADLLQQPGKYFESCTA